MGPRVRHIGLSCTRLRTEQSRKQVEFDPRPWKYGYVGLRSAECFKGPECITSLVSLWCRLRTRPGWVRCVTGSRKTAGRTGHAVDLGHVLYDCRAFGTRAQHGCNAWQGCCRQCNPAGSKPESDWRSSAGISPIQTHEFLVQIERHKVWKSTVSRKRYAAIPCRHKRSRHVVEAYRNQTDLGRQPCGTSSRCRVRGKNRARQMK